MNVPFFLRTACGDKVKKYHGAKDILVGWGLEKRRAEIDAALSGYAAVPTTLWFRELLLCLFTPQSNPYHAEASLVELEKRGLFNGDLSADEIASVLREPSRYVRFHRVKAGRVVKLLSQRSEIETILGGGHSPLEERLHIFEMVEGFGMKEASHALRNIGRRGLTILDRHILRCLVECGVLSEIPKTISKDRYLEIEGRFSEFAGVVGESLDVLDLLFWSKGSGSVFK